MLGANLLRGELVYLSSIKREDVPTFTRWFEDLDLQYLLFPMAVFPKTEKDENEWLDGIVRNNEKEFAIYTTDGDQLIGTCGFDEPDKRNHIAELGISIGEKSYWGHGYGTDAMRVLLRFGFAEMNLHKIELQVYSFNHRAIRSYEKLGFQTEVTHRQAAYRDGQYHDILLMGLLQSEWRNARQ